MLLIGAVSAQSWRARQCAKAMLAGDRWRVPAAVHVAVCCKRERCCGVAHLEILLPVLPEAVPRRVCDDLVVQGRSCIQQVRNHSGCFSTFDKLVFVSILDFAKTRRSTKIVVSRLYVNSAQYSLVKGERIIWQQS